MLVMDQRQRAYTRRASQQDDLEVSERGIFFQVKTLAVRLGLILVSHVPCASVWRPECHLLLVHDRVRYFFFLVLLCSQSSTKKTRLCPTWFTVTYASECYCRP